MKKIKSCSYYIDRERKAGEKLLVLENRNTAFKIGFFAFF